MSVCLCLIDESFRKEGLNELEIYVVTSEHWRSTMGSTTSTIQSPNSESVLSFVSSAPVTLFSATYCRYCSIAKKTLDDIGTSYTAVELDKMGSVEGGQLAMGLREVTGEGTVPQARFSETAPMYSNFHYGN